VLERARRYRPNYLVLPNDRERKLARVYANAAWAVYLPRIEQPPAPDPNDLVATQRRFIREVAEPNIEKNRKANARLQVVAPDGRPVYDLTYEVRQTASPFRFGCSLPFFVEPETDPSGDFQPPAVTDEQLERFLEIFNYSVIGYSGQWRYLEPAQDQRRYDDLDRYVAWCDEHGVGAEYHFVTGYTPMWLRARPDKEQAGRLMAHARDLANRYAGRIEAWQVVNLGIGLEQSPLVFQQLRELLPEAKLGISDCTRFYSSRPASEREQDMHRGLDDLRWLGEKKIDVDFIAFHAHRPLGLWADAFTMYEVFDTFAKEGVKVHISEFGVPLDGTITGPVRQGPWTADLQAEYYTDFFTVCFSHPAVEAINLGGIGPHTMLEGAGLLDAEGQPKPAFHALKELITHRWRTKTTGTLGLDGFIGFRGFHGTYDLTLTLASGRQVTARFQVMPGRANDYRFRFDRQAGTLTQVRE
jgi:GH35 family endo-1,4-beta-xylanase